MEKESQEKSGLLKQDLQSIVNYGDLFGAFFLRNPLREPAPSVRINTGTKSYILSSSKTNETAVPGSTTISTAETNYTAEGTVQIFQTTITNITTQVNTRTNTTTVQRRVTEFYDPLAQSFSVGGSGTANDDEQGAFLSGCDTEPIHGSDTSVSCLRRRRNSETLAVSDLREQI